MDASKVPVPLIRTPCKRLLICLPAALLALSGCGGKSKDAASGPDLARELKREVKQKAKEVGKKYIPPSFKISAGDNKFNIDDEKGKPIIQADVVKVEGAFTPGKGPDGPVKLTTVKCRLYQQGKPQMDFQAPFATWDGKQLIADRTAHAVTADGATIVDARRAVWTASTGHLDLNDAKVQGMKQGKMDFTAQGRVAYVRGPVVNIPSGGRAQNSMGQQMQADRVVWQRESGKIEANGHVTLTDADTVITGQKLVADTRLKRGKITGGARIRTKRKLTAEARP